MGGTAGQGERPLLPCRPPGCDPCRDSFGTLAGGGRARAYPTVAVVSADGRRARAVRAVASGPFTLVEPAEGVCDEQTYPASTIDSVYAQAQASDAEA